MSDSYCALIDKACTPEQAPDAVDVASRVLMERGLIVPDQSEACVLGGLGHPPGPKASKVYVPGDGEGPFWELTTSGVEIHGSLWANLMGLGDLEAAICPACHVDVGGGFVGVLMDTVGDPSELDYVPELPCPACDAVSSVHRWKTTPPLGFVHFALVFWNWPPLDSEGWQLDVRKTLEEAVGRPLEPTYGRI